MDPKKLNNLAQLAKTDSGAFSSIYDYFYDKVFNYVRWNVNSKEAAQDIVSDVFFKALKNIENYNPKFYFSTWIFSIARNTLNDSFKKKKMETLDPEKEETIASKDSSTNSVNSMEKDLETKMYLNNLLQSLNEEEKDIISLKYFAELDIKEIAKMLSLPSKTVYTKVSRALTKLSKVSEKS